MSPSSSLSKEALKVGVVGHADALHPPLLGMPEHWHVHRILDLGESIPLKLEAFL